jgi:hypothetical protein
VFLIYPPLTSDQKLAKSIDRKYDNFYRYGHTHGRTHTLFGAWASTEVEELQRANRTNLTNELIDLIFQPFQSFQSPDQSNQPNSIKWSKTLFWPFLHKLF